METERAPVTILRGNGKRPRAREDPATVPEPYWPDWRTVCTSVIGRGHLGIYRECQDAFRCNFAALVDPRTVSNGKPPGPLIATISDGLGSARNSAVGSTLAVSIAQAAAEESFNAISWDTATPWLLTRTLSAVLESAVGQLRESVVAITAATRHEWPESSFNATLLIVVFRPPWLLTANVGDGFVVAQREDGQLLMVARPYVSASEANATVTALQPSALARASVTSLYDPELTGFAASTDGLKEISLDWERSPPRVLRALAVRHRERDHDQLSGHPVPAPGTDQRASQ
jgi:serine/threonine protein phosphatase PrpC